MEILLDELIAIESRMEDNFSNLHTQISELTCEFCESSVGKHRGPTARVQISQRFKKLSPKMMDEQTEEIQDLKADLKKLQAENEKLKPAFKEAQENLVALENYTRREKLAFYEYPRKSRRKLSGYHL